MPIINEKYDQDKIERLRHYIQSNADKGDPKDYEIFVDTLKVVTRTKDPDQFDSFEEYVNGHTEKVRILIYNSGATPRNDQYIFALSARANQELSGIEMESKMDEKLDAKKREWDAVHLGEKYQALEVQLKVAEEYIEELQGQLEQNKLKKFHIGDINVGEFASVMLESVIRRNPQWVSKFPGGETLAGMMVQDTKGLQAATPETTASFRRAEQGEGLTDEDREWIIFLKQMQAGFTEEDLKSVHSILGKLSQKRELIQTVVELLTETPN